MMFVNSVYGDFFSGLQKLRVIIHVNRIASTVRNPKNLYPPYTMLFSVPGIPSVYYGSKNGIKGIRTNNSDYQLRPSLPPFSRVPYFAVPALQTEGLNSHIKKLSEIRQKVPALQDGNYRDLSVSNTTFAFMREKENSRVIAAFNCEDFARELDLKTLGQATNLFTGEKFYLKEKYILPGNDSVLLEIN